MLATLLTAAFLTSGGATLGPEKLAWLALVVLVSADVPIIPTGATVSTTAVLAGHGPLRLLAVVGFATAGAWAGDVGTLLVIEWGGGRILGRFVDRLRGTGSRAARVGEQLRTHSLRLLVISRLIPGGRFPVLLAAAGGGVDRRRYIVDDLPACLVWSAVYAAIGVAGGAISGSPVVAILVVLALIAVLSLLHNRIEAARHHLPAPAEEPAE